MVKHRWFKDGDGVWCVQVGVKPYHFYMSEESVRELAAEREEVLLEKDLTRGEAPGSIEHKRQGFLSRLMHWRQDEVRT